MVDTTTDLIALRDLAVRAARAGGEQARGHFRDPTLAVERKHDSSPVTIADREAEAVIKRTLLEARPDDGWLGEETGTATGTSGYRWIVDPIDGTKNFVRGVPLWATLVACEQDLDGRSEVVASAVYLPGLNEMYDAWRGGGARCNDAAIAVSGVTELGDALWCFETPGWFAEMGLTAVFDALCAQTQLQRGLGDAFGHMLVASGRAEVVVEPSLSVWDVAATSLVVREAGGRFSALDGSDTIRANNAVVTNGALHEAVLGIIAAA